MFKVIKKADIILFIILVSIGFLLSWLAYSAGRTGGEAVVTVDGKVYGVYNLNKNQTITVKQNNNTNKITIKNGQVQMTYSSCKNQVCVKEGAISKTNQSIVCLPNRVMVEIRGKDGKYDAISD